MSGVSIFRLTGVVFWYVVVDPRVRRRRRPGAEQLRGRRPHVGLLELPDDDELAVRRAVEPRVKFPHVVQRDLVEVLDLLVDRADVPDIAPRERVHRAVERERRERGRVGPVALDAGDALLLHLVEVGVRERRLAQHLDGEPQRRHQVRLGRADRRRGAPGSAGDVDARVQLQHLVLELLARLGLRAAHQQRARQVGRRRASPASDFSSPNRSWMVADTVPPREVFGSITSFMPFGSVARTRRFSTLAGVESNASPAETDSPVL